MKNYIEEVGEMLNERNTRISVEWNPLDTQTEIESLKTKNAELQAVVGKQWVSMSEFKNSSYEGWCWIVSNGQVEAAYVDSNTVFWTGIYSRNWYVHENISWVMEWT